MGTATEVTLTELRSAAKRIYTEELDFDRAESALFAEISADRGSRAIAVRFAARELIHEAMRAHRDRIRANLSGRDIEPGADSTLRESYEEELLTRRRARSAFAEWPLRTGSALRVATVAQVREQIQYHRANEVGNRQIADALEAVLAKMPKAEDAIVGEHVEQSELEEIGAKYLGGGR